MAMITRASSPSNDEPFPTRQKIGSSKVYVVLTPMGPAEYRFFIYIVDLYEKVDRSDPVLRLRNDFPYGMAFAIVNSTLYMFGGSGLPNWRLPSYSYRLSPKSRTCDIQFKDVNPISQMHRIKISPHAVFIGDQICVFSSFLDGDGSNFEMYDPDTDQWHSLPDPPIDYANVPRQRNKHDGINYCTILFHCVESLVLFIYTVAGSYFIDFGQPRDDRKWVSCNLPLPYRQGCLHSQPFLKDGDFVLTPSFNVYNLKNVTNPRQQQPMLSFSYMRNPALKSKYKGRSIFLLPKNGTEERPRACIFETGGPESSPFVSTYDSLPDDSMLGFYLFEFDYGNDNDSKKLSIAALNSGLFHLDVGIYTHDIHVTGVFPM